MVGLSFQLEDMPREKHDALKPGVLVTDFSWRISTGGALDSYAAVCRDGLFAAAQSPAWIEAWVANVAPDYIIATMSDAGKPIFALALEIVRAGPFKVARFMGGKHANGNFPAMSADFNGAASSGFQSLVEAVHAVRPDIDLIALERMAPTFGGTSNPLLALPHAPSPNLSLEVALEQGFDAVISRSKSLRGKHRWQVRKFEASGGFRRIEARSQEEVTTLLNEFFLQKEIRLKKMGIANVFGDAKVRSFFRALFAGAVGDEKPAFVLHGLEIGGKLRAIAGSSRRGDRIACDILSISEDEATRLRPGEYLFYENIREAAEEGLKVYDFGVGDEPHKRRWCDTEISHIDVLAPLGMKGHVLARALRAANRAKALVKNNAVIWKTVKMLRRRATGEKPEAIHDENR